MYGWKKNHSESEEEDDIDVHQPLVKYILMRSPKSCRRMTATLKARRGSSWCPTPGLQPLIIAIRSTHPTCPNSDLLLLDLPQREKVLNSGGLRSDPFLWDSGLVLCDMKASIVAAKNFFSSSSVPVDHLSMNE